VSFCAVEFIILIPCYLVSLKSQATYPQTPAQAIDSLNEKQNNNLLELSPICVTNNHMISRSKLAEVFYKSIYDTVIHDGIEHAGYLAFLSILSIFPFLVLMVALAGSFGQSQLGLQFVDVFINEIPEHFIAALKPRIADIVSGPSPSLKIISVLAMVWTASSAVEGLRTILNRAYRVATPPAYVRRRFMSIIQFIIIMLLIIIAMFLLIFVPPIWHSVAGFLKIDEVLSAQWTYLRYFVSAAIVFLSVGASYYVLPNIKQKWSHVWPGTFLVMIFWIVAATGLSGYINNFEQVNLVYGSLEGIIIALLFFYILGVIYIFGAEFNYHIEKALGHKVYQKERVPKQHRRKGDILPSGGKPANKKK
jgi:membrane protein